jgi:hypothetical protein
LFVLSIRKINSIAYSDGTLARGKDTANGGLNWLMKETTMALQGKEKALYQGGAAGELDEGFVNSFR